MFFADDGDDEEKDEATAWPDALVDALLSLLSKTTAPLPSTPLRDAVEAVFRNMCDSVTATGELGSLAPLQDLGSEGLDPGC